jgi:hypothetical protein
VVGAASALPLSDSWSATGATTGGSSVAALQQLDSGAAAVQQRLAQLDLQDVQQVRRCDAGRRSIGSMAAPTHRPVRCGCHCHTTPIAPAMGLPTQCVPLS